MPNGRHSKNKGRETGKDLVCFKNEYPVWVRSKVKDGEKGQVMNKVGNVDFVLNSPLLVSSYLSGLFILECLRILPFIYLGPNIIQHRGTKWNLHVDNSQRIAPTQLTNCLLNISTLTYPKQNLPINSSKPVPSALLQLNECQFYLSRCPHPKPRSHPWLFSLTRYMESNKSFDSNL